MHRIRVGGNSIPCRPGTRLYLLIGHPVAHSLSPRLQAAALRAAGLAAEYVACDVSPGELAGAMRELRRAAGEGRVGGFNVTAPHKSAVLAHLDGLDDVARAAGAVNTVRIEMTPGATAAVATPRLLGHDTDVDGLRAALAETGARLAGARVVVLGSGGMARATVLAALRESAAAVRVCSRSVIRAREMLESVTDAWRGHLPHLSCAALGEDSAELLADAQVLVQATSVGLHPEDPSPVSLEAAPRDLFVFDAVYQPPETALLRAARARGLRTANGLGMLLHQGAAAFALWTGLEPPLEVMRRSLEG